LHFIELYILFTYGTSTEEASKEAQPKEQENLSTQRDKISEGKTSSSSTTVKKTRVKQEVRKNRNICSSPISSKDEQGQAPTVGEQQKVVLEKQIMHAVEESQATH